jgi:hypothetical protein
MDKVAVVSLQFDKVNSAFWLAIFEHAKERKITEHTDWTFVAVTVKNFSLEDHQFVRIDVAYDHGEVAQLWVPRECVRMIAEGKTDLSAAFSFAGSKIKKT